MHRMAAAALRQGRDQDSMFQSPPEELCCPVCQKPLSLPPSIKHHSLMEGTGKKAANFKQDWKLMQSGKSKEGEIIIAAMCGHLFHTFCLRHYCFVYRSGNFQSDRVECPMCYQFISMIKVHMIDYKAHIGIKSEFEKDYKHTDIMNKELMQQKAEGLKKLLKLEKLVEDASKKLQTYRSHEDKFEKRAATINNQIALKEEMLGIMKECNQGIDRMHKENVHLIKMYLSHLRAHPKQVLKDKRIPPALIPYLAIIQGDDRLMRKFGEILKPIEINGLRSNTEMLIREILADAEPKAKEKAERMSKHLANIPKHFQLTRDEANPVVVKVQRSSVSIFSKALLDNECLHQIMQQVKAPIKSLKEAHEKVKKKKNLSPVKKSASDIQILFEHKKRQTESTPNRMPIEETTLQGKELAVARRCKSTEPILITTNCRAGPKVLIVKLDDLKPVKNMGDHASSTNQNQSKDAKNAKGDQAIGQTGFLKSCRTEIVTLDSNCGHDKSNNLMGESSQATGDGIVSAVEEANNPKSHNTCEPVVKGSVLEILFENVHENGNSDNSFVDEVSRLVVQKEISNLNFVEKVCEQTSQDGKEASQFSEMVEYKIEAKGNEKVSLESNLQKQLSNNGKQLEQLDVENEVKLSEVIVDPSSDRDSMGYGANSVLQGILPGPYITSARPLRPTDYPLGPVSARKQLPEYLSKWMKNLPSARLGQADFVTSGQQYLPPPPLSSNYVSLPPLPKTPPPPLHMPTVRKMPPTNLIESYATSGVARNRPYGDEISDTNASYKIFDENDSLRNIVVEMPKLQAKVSKLQPIPTGVIHKPIRLKGYNSNRWISGVMEHPCKCCPNNSVPDNRMRCDLPPLQEEGFRRNVTSNLGKPPPIPLNIRRSNRVVAQPVGVHIVVQPTFSTMNTARPRSSRHSGLKPNCQHPQQFSHGHPDTYECQQFPPEFTSIQQNPQNNINSSFRHEIFTSQMYDITQCSLNQIPNQHHKHPKYLPDNERRSKSLASDPGVKFSEKNDDLCQTASLRSKLLLDRSKCQVNSIKNLGWQQHVNPKVQSNHLDTRRLHSNMKNDDDINSSVGIGINRVVKRARRRQNMHV